MLDTFKDLEQKFVIVFRKMENYKKSVLLRNNLGELSNPEILMILKSCKNDEGTPQKEIVKMCGVSAPTVTISIKRMEAKGLLSRIKDNTTRENYIKLTPKGNELIEKFIKQAEIIQKQVLEGFTEEEIKQMNDFAVRATNNIIKLLDAEK